MFDPAYIDSISKATTREEVGALMDKQHIAVHEIMVRRGEEISAAVLARANSKG
jgi:ribosomal protein L19E